MPLPYIIYNIVYGAQIDRLQFPGISNPLRKLDKMRFVKTTKIRPKRALDRAVCADVTKRGMQEEQKGKKKGRNPSKVTKSDKKMQF